MARGIRHAHINRAMARSASQRISASHGSATTGDASQRTCIAAAPQVEQPKKKEEGSQGPKQNWRCHYQEPRWPLYQVVTSEYISN